MSGSKIFVIGTSAGGVDILGKILPAFKNAHCKVAVVIHMASGGPNLIPELMAPKCDFKVTEAIPGEPIENRHIYIAPTNYHLCIEPNHIMTLSSEDPVNYSRPSIDILFESAAYAFGKDTVGILLTGANNDGAKGLKTIKELGGLTILQDPDDAEFETMPLSALEIMRPDRVLKSEEIVRLISVFCEQGIFYA